MKVASSFSAFNARWISPEEVARTFVPVPQFVKLVQTQSSLLMGPRGCGKTTLLKMLTRRAQECWFNERVRREERLRNRFPRPDFEAIYVPSDVRWSYELKALETSHTSDPSLSLLSAITLQRVMVVLSGLIEATKAFEILLRDDAESSQRVAMALIDHWDLKKTVPTFSHLRIKLMSWAAQVRSSINKNDYAETWRIVESLPDSFTGHALDALILVCSIYDEIVGNYRQPKRWGLCFDEIEIGPEWLRRELISAFRSVDQRFLLKLTWSPVLPEFIAEGQSQKADYQPIRIWHSHLDDARPFCREFSTQVIRDKLGLSKTLPRDVFGSSLFASEERLGRGQDVYARGSQTWKAMVELAKREGSFREFLKDNGLNPANPISDRTRDKDQCLRKIKPIVLLRETFRGAGHVRSRKRIALYAGEEAIYAMSDGNPRWLSWILNDLLDRKPKKKRRSAKEPHIPAKIQAPILRAASEVLKTHVKSYPVDLSAKPAMARIHLSELVETLGNYFASELLGGTFSGDPTGSFIVDESINTSLYANIEAGLLLGAFIYVGSSAGEAAPAIRGSRLRLCFMLAPSYRLLFRNYRAIHLSSILAGIGDPRQRELFKNVEVTSE